MSGFWEAVSLQEYVDVHSYGLRVRLTRVYPEVPGTVPWSSRNSTRVYQGYVCDSNVDCEDGYDENPELCAAGMLRHFFFFYRAMLRTARLFPSSIIATQQTCWRQVRNKVAASQSIEKLRGNCCNGFWGFMPPYVVCPSVCLSVRDVQIPWSHRLEYFERPNRSRLIYTSLFIRNTDTNKQR